MSHLLSCYSLWRFWLVKNHLSSLRKRRFSTWKAKAILPRSCGSPVSGRSVPWLPCAEDGRYSPRQGQNRVGRVNPGPPHANSRLFLRRSFNAPFLSFRIATACKDSRQYGTWKMARLYFPSQHLALSNTIYYPLLLWAAPLECKLHGARLLLVPSDGHGLTPSECLLNKCSNAQRDEETDFLLPGHHSKQARPVF